MLLHPPQLLRDGINDALQSGREDVPARNVSGIITKTSEGFTRRGSN
jgi:hypothetical protein